jgi:hypothetical protein
MSLLHQNSDEIDDAALGEEFTKGTSHLVVAGIVAAVLVTIGIAVYFIAGQKPPAATGEIEQIWVHPQHSESSGFDANGASVPQESFDQVYVFALVKLHNQGKQPLFLHRIDANLTLPSGIDTSYAAPSKDYDRLFEAYPTMPVPHGKALSAQATIQPGETIEGTFVSAFSLTKDQWAAGKDLSFDFAIQYQPSLKLTPHTPITMQ